MDAYSINEIKNELVKYKESELLSFCMRLAKFKKENKELLGFILFEAGDLNSYTDKIREDIDEQFGKINMDTVYFIKKSVRKILRNCNKQIRFSLSKQVEAEILIHFCNNFITHSIPVKKSPQLMNIYLAQRKKIEEALSTLHPDLQYDLRKQVLE